MTGEPQSRRVPDPAGERPLRSGLHAHERRDGYVRVTSLWPRLRNDPDPPAQTTSHEE